MTYNKMSIILLRYTTLKAKVTDYNTVKALTNSFDAYIVSYNPTTLKFVDDTGTTWCCCVPLNSDGSMLISDSLEYDHYREIPY